MQLSIYIILTIVVISLVVGFVAGALVYRNNATKITEAITDLQDSTATLHDKVDVVLADTSKAVNSVVNSNAAGQIIQQAITTAVDGAVGDGIDKLKAHIDTTINGMVAAADTAIPASAATTAAIAGVAKEAADAIVDKVVTDFQKK